MSTTRRRYSKRWSYTAITTAAEARIISLMTTDMEEGSAHADHRRQWAYGVFLGWNSLTLGWQNDGDSARLESLATGRQKVDLE